MMSNIEMTKLLIMFYKSKTLLIKIYNQLRAALLNFQTPAWHPRNMRNFKIFIMKIEFINMSESKIIISLIFSQKF